MPTLLADSIRGIVVLAILSFSLMVKVKRQEALDRSFGVRKPQRYDRQ